MSTENVILVNENGEIIGSQEKMQAHRDGHLHLAFSVLLYRDGEKGIEFLLQQRDSHKYHSGGCWTNTCCSHPREGEHMIAAGVRRLQEEMGITEPVYLQDVASFVYRAELDNDFIEYELDHVLVAKVDHQLVVEPNPNEVMAFCWWSQSELMLAMMQNPTQFTAWFPSVFSHTLKIVMNA